jgi:hypothetical protein
LLHLNVIILSFVMNFLIKTTKKMSLYFDCSTVTLR